MVGQSVLRLGLTGRCCYVRRGSPLWWRPTETGECTDRGGTSAEISMTFNGTYFAGRRAISTDRRPGDVERGFPRPERRRRARLQDQREVAAGTKTSFAWRIWTETCSANPPLTWRERKTLDGHCRSIRRRHRSVSSVIRLAPCATGFRLSWTRKPRCVPKEMFHRLNSGSLGPDGAAAEISRRWFRARNSYGVAIAPGPAGRGSCGRHHHDRPDESRGTS